MIPTKEYLQEAFDGFNSLCFGGELPRPTLKLSRARTRLGWMRYKYRKDGAGLARYDFVIAVTVAYDLPREMLDDVIIHEMIHYLIAYKGLRDTSPHGQLFRRFMREINERHGRHVSVSARRASLVGCLKTS